MKKEKRRTSKQGEEETKKTVNLLFYCVLETYTVLPEACATDVPSGEPANFFPFRYCDGLLTAPSAALPVDTSHTTTWLSSLPLTTYRPSEE
jgi:hypothetical protein